MSNTKYICPRCGKEMSWTGNVSQNLNIKYCDVVYEYKCRNVDCGYKTKYERLDEDGIHYKNMIDSGRFCF